MLTAPGPHPTPPNPRPHISRPHILMTCPGYLTIPGQRSASSDGEGGNPNLPPRANVLRERNGQAAEAGRERPTSCEAATDRPTRRQRNRGSESTGGAAQGIQTAQRHKGCATTTGEYTAAQPRARGARTHNGAHAERTRANPQLLHWGQPKLMFRRRIIPTRDTEVLYPTGIKPTVTLAGAPQDSGIRPHPPDDAVSEDSDDTDAPPQDKLDSMEPAQSGTQAWSTTHFAKQGP